MSKAKIFTLFLITIIFLSAGNYYYTLSQKNIALANEYFEKAETAKKTYNYKLAAEYLENASKLSPKNYIYAMEASFNFKASDNKVKGEFFYQKACNIAKNTNPSSIDSIVCLRRKLYSLQKPSIDEAIEQNDSANALLVKHYGANHGTIPENNYDLGDWLIEQKAYDKAILAIEKSQEQSPAGIKLFTIGSLYHELKQPEKAKEFYEQALKSLEKSSISYDNYILFLRKRLNLKKQALNNSLTAEVNEKNEDLFEKALTEKVKVKYKNAYNILKEVVESNPNEFKYMSLMAEVCRGIVTLEQSEQYSLSAVELSRKVNPLSNDYIHALDHLGRIYERREKYDEAIKMYEESYLVYITRERNEVPQVFLSYIYLSTLYEKRGDFENALKYYLKGVERTENRFGKLSFSYAADLAKVARIYMKMGRTKLAIDYYQQSLFVFSKTTPSEHVSYLTTQKEYYNALKMNE